MSAELAIIPGNTPQMRQDARRTPASAPDGTSLPLRLLTHGLAPLAGDGSFGQAVRAGRAARGWSRAELARRAGVNDRTVREVERGRLPFPSTVEALAGAFAADDEARAAWVDTALDAGAYRGRPGGFARRLRRCREAAGLSVYGLAGRVGCDASYLTRLESGERREPGRALVEALADALDLDDEETDDLLLAAGHLPSWAGDPTVRQVAALLACLPGPAARRLRDRVAAAWERERGGAE